MIEIKQTLSKKDESKVKDIVNEIKVPYEIESDFYYTKNRLRLYIRENLPSFFKTLRKGNYIIFCDTGIAVITGISDKFPRKYVKILSDTITAKKLLKIIAWNVKTELYCKIKKDNPLKEPLLKNGFRFCAGRGKEILYVRKPNNDNKD